jgi:hypothetical protein
MYSGKQEVWNVEVPKQPVTRLVAIRSALNTLLISGLFKVSQLRSYVEPNGSITVNDEF